MKEEIKEQHVTKSFAAGERITMRDGVEYIVSDRGEFIRLTPRTGKKSNRRAIEVK